ncbi:alpha/beta hydrolase [Ferrimonas balearica]|uniref:alpha/beta hydrolase n=1 Tax=Ferrimonas balearica TaxID=44012 RepID=UPI001C57D51E|nr:alpha/beta hydrolase [Ferrimonas balearica]MBW3164035.1 alpha/beta hydrolase [Ferrimonas balearica]
MLLWASCMLSGLLVGCGSSPFYAPDQQLGTASHQYPHPVIDYYLDSRSGNRLHVQRHLSSPPNANLVVHFHGNAGNLSKTSEKVVWLVDHGFDVLLFDYSGYGQSSGNASRETLRLDGITFLEHVSALSRPSGQRRILIGTSMGGAVLVDALASSELQTEFDLLVIDSSFDHYSKLARDVISRYPLSYLVAKVAEWTVSDQHAPADQIDKLKAIPLLVAHCQEDGLIPLERGFELFEQAQTAKVFWSMEKCLHARTFTAEHPDNQQLLLEQFELLPPVIMTASQGVGSASQTLK